MPAVKNPPGHHLKAVLGPTNTGKTHLAVERMLGHASGMIGLPLRLLAREVYDRVAAAKGKTRAALITGEEKILPPNPAYYIATVEAMPVSKPVSFLAVDEVQLAADRERGHVFTNRLLNARGQDETMLMGSNTIESALRKLLPDAQIIKRARFSELTYVKPKKLNRLPKRTAVIAFSLERVYAVAELLRRTYGGVAVVMGALSPTTRNAQVEMYQSGEVDYIVATDAIGMGLNMDIDHVVFADVEKFDGRARRKLHPHELAQIAGRAGRYMRPGTFTCLSEIGDALSPFEAERIENHVFKPLKKLNWRNADLDFNSLARLIKSLERKPDHALLSPAEEALDLTQLKAYAASEETGRLSRADVQALWQVCRVPDFPQTSQSHHLSLIKKLYDFIRGDGKIPSRWMAARVSALDNTQGNIDTLMHKIAGIRTWTYISHHPGWCEDAAHWAEVTGKLEDKLSVALHERIQQRFVDKRTSALMKNIGEKGLKAQLDEDGTVSIEGHALGVLKGFCFTPSADLSGEEGKTLIRRAEKHLRPLAAERAEKLTRSSRSAFTLELPKGEGRVRILWQGAPVAILVRGQSVLAPEIQLTGHPLLEDKDIQACLSKLKAWLKAECEDHLEALLRLDRAVGSEKSDLPGLTRGLAFKMVENLGVVARHYVDNDVRALTPEDRKALHKLGFWFAANFVYLPKLLKPAPTKWRLALWGAWNEVSDWPDLPEDGVMWATTQKKTPRGFYQTLGYRPVGDKAVRIDRLEKLFDAVRPLGMNNEEFTVTPEIMGLVGLSGDDFAAVMRFLGYAHRTEIPEDQDKSPTPETKAGRKKEDGEKESAEKDEAPKPVYYFKWAPKKPAPFKGKTPGKKPYSGTKGKSRGKDKEKAGKPARKTTPRPARDPADSPFAALKDLKLKTGQDKDK